MPPVVLTAGDHRTVRPALVVGKEEVRRCLQIAPGQRRPGRPAELLDHVIRFDREEGRPVVVALRDERDRLQFPGGVERRFPLEVLVLVVPDRTVVNLARLVHQAGEAPPEVVETLGLRLLERSRAPAVLQRHPCREALPRHRHGGPLCRHHLAGRVGVGDHHGGIPAEQSAHLGDVAARLPDVERVPGVGETLGEVRIDVSGGVEDPLGHVRLRRSSRAAA
jgi:hypothetical protein